ncbi:MAG: cupin domain-containing protein [Nanoarchaeota archaeon]|nr:cupin domain-containing protein [Nanoarchaeota archaeon]
MLKDIDKIEIRKKLSLFKEYWNPKIIGELNDCNVMVVKCKGELPWHHHDDEDEMFLVVKGEFIVRLKNKELHLKEGECAFIPKGVEHQTAALRETHLIYVSKKGSVNTGNVSEERTVTEPQRI